MNKYKLKKIMQLLISPLIITSLFFSTHASAQTISAPEQKKNDTNLSPEELNKIKNMPYNEDLFKTNYQLFIYNSNMNAAYQLAQIAVKKNPTDMEWHIRLAQSATWAGDYSTGMQEWLYIAQHTKDEKMILTAAATAKALDFYVVLVPILKIYLAKHPDDIKKYIELAMAENRIGHPQQALSTLRKLNEVHPTLDGYVTVANILQDLNQWNEALQVWHYINTHYPPVIANLMAEATIYYTQLKFDDALNVLIKGINVAKNNDDDYWGTLSELAWTINNRRFAILGYKHGKLDLDNYQRLVALEIKTNPRDALDYSLLAWKRFHNADFLSTSLLLGSQLKQWRLVSNIMQHLSGKELQQAQKLLIYWQTLENMYSSANEDNLRRKLLLLGISLEPQLIELKTDLLWTLLNNGENEHIKYVMDLWYREDYWQDDQLWQAYANGFEVLNKYYPGLVLYQIHQFDNFQENQLIIDYANLLDKAQLYQEAYFVRQFLWNRLISKNDLNKSGWRSICQLAPFYVSGTAQVEYLTALLHTGIEDEDINIVLNWITQRSYTDLIAYIKAYYYKNQALPDWAEINLALAKNDLPDLQRIMAHTERQWTRSDRINAAVRLENIPLALDFAFRELTDRPNATEIYTEFALYGLADANYFSIGEEYEQFVDVAGPRTKLEARLRLDNTWKILPYASYWALKNTDQQITNLPASDNQAGFKLFQRIHRGDVTYHVGYRNDLATFFLADVTVNYQLNSRWGAKATIGFNQESYEDAYLREGGVQDQIGIQLGYTYDDYNSVLIDVLGVGYYSQDRHYLANGYDIAISAQHKFWLSYPDYTIGVFSDVHEFNRNGSFGGDIVRLFPPGTPPFTPDVIAANNAANYKLLIPNPYYDNGIFFSFGNTILDYTHAWRPYFWGSLFYNSLTRVSYDFKGGLNGTVFGSDSLLIYGEYGTSQTSVLQKNFTIGARYLVSF